MLHTTSTNGNGIDRHPTPATPGDWTIQQIVAALSRPLPTSILQQRKQGGRKIAYLPWHTAAQILDRYAPGWSWEIRTIHTSSDRVFLVGRLTVPTASGPIWREASGTELLKEQRPIKDRDERYLLDEYGRPITEPAEVAYGDPSSNAESMAFRRAAAKFGLALYLYK